MRTVAGLLAADADRVLLVFKKGFWFFPGGKQEEGEPLEATLRRELAEELGLRIRGEAVLFDRRECDAPQGERFRFHTFACSALQLSGSPRLDPADTVTAFAWVDRPLELNLTEHARCILELEEQKRKKRAA